MMCHSQVWSVTILYTHSSHGNERERIGTRRGRSGAAYGIGSVGRSRYRQSDPLELGMGGLEPYNYETKIVFSEKGISPHSAGRGTHYSLVTFFLRGETIPQLHVRERKQRGAGMVLGSQASIDGLYSCSGKCDDGNFLQLNYCF